MIFIDSNIPMYLIGNDQNYKNKVQKTLNDLVHNDVKLVTSVEVFQEIIYRYSKINRLDVLDDVFERLTTIVDNIFSTTLHDIILAKENTKLYCGKMSSRDCLHLATMINNNVYTIYSFDQGFDMVKNIKRITSVPY